MYSKDRYKSTIAFVDLLFNILVGFVFLFLVAFLLINPVAKKSDITKKAEFIIQLSWPDESSDDIDLWVMDPQGRRIGFNNKEQGFTNLERDDLGQRNDIVIINGIPNIVKKNEEITSIRGILPGTYHISAHFYSQFKVPSPPIPITVKVIKINPYKEVYTGQKYIKEQGDIVNFIRFNITDNGMTSDLEDSKVSAVGKHGGRYGETSRQGNALGGPGN